MKSIFPLLMVASTLCAADPKLDHLKVEPLPFPTASETQPAMLFEMIVSTADELDPIIGGYPPKYTPQSDRTTTYEKWSQAILALEASSTADEPERDLVLKARLYRQGHNMDVRECGEKASKTIEAGLHLYPDSIPMNFQASYFYLQIHPRFAPEGEKALLRLRRLLGTDKNPEVERGFVFAYLFQNKIKEAKKQVDRCLKINPDDETMLKLRDGLKAGKVQRISN